LVCASLARDNVDAMSHPSEAGPLRRASVTLAAMILVTAGAVGCKARGAGENGTPSPVASVAPSATPLGAGLGSAPATGAVRRVSDQDCAQWADHGVEVVVTGFVDAARQCPQRVRDDVRGKFVEHKSSLRDGAKALCSTHLNQPYPAADGACFLSATTARDLVSCKLGPMTNPGDSDWAAKIDDLKKQCAGIGTGAGGSASPDPTL
jgi:hypothetical protein